jgi:hypothetical protein
VILSGENLVYDCPKNGNLATVGPCSSGQLTLKGFRQMRELGEDLRRVYGADSKLAFLPPRYNSSVVLARSTDTT